MLPDYRAYSVLYCVNPHVKDREMHAIQVLQIASKIAFAKLLVFLA